jgi:hypothetical protein
MNLKEYSQPSQLERYSFLWSQARLVVAAVALFLGGVPVLQVILPYSLYYSVGGVVLTLSWIVSGVASGYMLYRWFSGRKMIFGGNAPLDTAAFFVSVVSGINLGLAGFTGSNIGMSMFSGRFIFAVVALVYLASAYHLFRRWSASGQKVF